MEDAPGTEFFAWQVCVADTATNSVSNADDYPAYLINREPIIQMLGIGMASGQNAYPVEDQMFVIAVTKQEDGEIKMVSPEDAQYKLAAPLISEELLAGKDKGMIAVLPTGKAIVMQTPVDPNSL